MFWFTVVAPVVCVLALWPWRWVFRDDAPWGGWPRFDRNAPGLLGVVLVLFLVTWLIGDGVIVGDSALNFIGIGIDLCAFMLVARYLWIVLEDAER
jgi:hypothetical protein